jgi:hypothetical protein
MYRRWRADGEREEWLRCPWLRSALIVWLVLAAAVSVRTLVRPSRHTVFPIFAASAKHWWGDEPLYEDDPILDNFRYPPVFTLFVTPFSVLGLSMGGIVWSWVSMAVYIAGLWWFVRDVIPSTWTRKYTAVFLMLGALGALRGLWNAQSNALIVGLLLMGAAAVARAAREQWMVDGGWWMEKKSYPPSSTIHHPPSTIHWWLAALLLAAPVCLKLTPLAPVLLLVALWPRQLAWRLTVVSAGFFLLPFLTRPPNIVLDHYRGWFEHLLEKGDERWLGFRDGWTVWIVLRHLLGGASGEIALREPLDATWYRPLQLATAAAVLLWCLWQKRRAARLGLGRRWLVFVTLSMGLAWLMLFGPAVEHATYVFLAPPLMWAFLERRAWPIGRGLIVAAFVLIMILGWGAVSRLLPMWPILLTALPAGTALFALWLIGYARSCRTRGVDRESWIKSKMLFGPSTTYTTRTKATTIQS